MWIPLRGASCCEDGRGPFVLAPFRQPRYRPRMPRDGALTLSDVRSPTLSIVCGGRYAVARLFEQPGDAKLTQLLVTLADCPKARSATMPIPPAHRPALEPDTSRQELDAGQFESPPYRVDSAGFHLRPVL